jgi:regulator of sigma E protease
LIDNGFRNGDKILKIDGQPVEQTADVVEKILIEGRESVEVQRDSQLINITLPKNLNQKVLAANEKDIVSVRYPFVIADVSSGSPAEKAKLLPGDSIIGINGKKLSMFQDIAMELDASRGTHVTLSFIRKTKTMETMVLVSENGKLGVGVQSPYVYLKTKSIKYGFLAAIPAGINLGVETLGSYIKGFKLVFTKEGSKQLGGFGSIGKMFPKTWDWQIFWSMTALLSVILAFMNFLPIPALDGGYVLFLIYEMITGKKPSDKFLEYAQTFGMLLLFALLLYANGNDLFKAIFK